MKIRFYWFRKPTGLNQKSVIMSDSPKSLPRQISVLILFILICLATGWAGAQVSPGNGASEWYGQLNKPDWNPPGWVFGPVWTTFTF